MRLWRHVRRWESQRQRRVARPPAKQQAEAIGASCFFALAGPFPTANCYSSLRVQVPKQEGFKVQKPFRVWILEPKTLLIWVFGPSGVPYQKSHGLGPCLGWFYLTRTQKFTPEARVNGKPPKTELTLLGLGSGFRGLGFIPRPCKIP